MHQGLEHNYSQENRLLEPEKGQRELRQTEWTLIRTGLSCQLEVGNF